jgi:hypothetical protein
MDIQAEDDYVKIAEIALAGVAEAGSPGAFLVDILPVMKYIPEWFPGAAWKKKANWWKHVTALLANQPWKQIKDQMVSEHCLFGVGLSDVDYSFSVIRGTGKQLHASQQRSLNISLMRIRLIELMRNSWPAMYVQ